MFLRFSDAAGHWFSAFQALRSLFQPKAGVSAGIRCNPGPAIVRAAAYWLRHHRSHPGASRVAQIHHKLVEKEFMFHGPGQTMFVYFATACCVLLSARCAALSSSLASLSSVQMQAPGALVFGMACIH